jgi:hypothetical protein
MRVSLVVLWSLVVYSAVGVAQSEGGRSLQLHDVSGRTLTPFAPTGSASVIFFVATDCPVSNAYAPEIQRVCR